MAIDGAGRLDEVAILRQLEEHAHELSNFVGITMNLLIRAAASDERGRVMDDVQAAADISIKAVGTLRRLMLKLSEMQALLLR